MNDDARPSLSDHVIDPPSDASADKPSRLVPIELQDLMQDRAILSFENADRYDDLQSQMMAQFAPRDAVEFLLVKDLTDAQWNAIRMRRMREAAIDAALPELAWSYLRWSYMKAHAQPLPDPHAAEEDGEGEEEDEVDVVQRELDEQDAREAREANPHSAFMIMMHRAKAGDPDMRSQLDALMDGAGLTHDMLYQAAFRQSLKSMSVLEDMMSRAQARRDQILRMIEDRRRTSHAMSRSLLNARDHANIEDVPFRARRR